MKEVKNYTELEPACIYLRKSREDLEAEARGEGETLAKHKRALFRLAKELGVNITKIYPEVITGESLIHRPEMLQLLKDVEAGKWKSVFVMEIDRLGRGNMQEQGLILETFKQSGTLIVTPRKVYNLLDEFDEEYSEFEAFMARKELKIIKRRLQGGRIRSVEEGNYIGARPPYGYLIAHDEKGNRYLIPHPEQAPVVIMIFEWYTHDDPEIRMGTAKIANELNKLGYKSYSGIAWQASSVLNIIKNAVYAGRLQWGKKEQKKSTIPGKKRDTKTRPRDKWTDVKGKHEALIPMELYLKAQQILKGKYHVPYQLINHITNPLAGLVKCEICGSSMVYRPYINQKYPHLICINRFCPNKSSRFEYVEKRVLDGLQLWLNQYRAQWGNIKSPDKFGNVVNIKKQALQNLERELTELEKQKSRLHDFLERGTYDESTYLERSQVLSQRIKSTNNSIKETRADLENDLQKELAQKEIIPKVEHILQIYSKLNPAEKNNLLKSVLEFVEYKKEKYQRDDDFTLVIHPRLPK